MEPPKAYLQVTKPSGSWSVHAGEKDVTFFRGVPVQVASLSDTDPFGPAEATLVFPQVSPLERIGVPGSDLWWLRPDQRVEITFTASADLSPNASGVWFPTTYSWKGFLQSFDWGMQGGQTSLSVGCVGALRALDNLVAMPNSTFQPYPYETAIINTINEGIERLGRRDRALCGPGGAYLLDKMQPFAWGWWLPQWTKKYRAADWQNTKMYMRPFGLDEGQPWSGLLTRERGQGDKLLSSYVQGLLSMMYTEWGRFTIRLQEGTWSPQMQHINMWEHGVDFQLLRVNALWPGVDFQLSSDYSQSLTTLYGTVSSSFSGTTYTGEQWTDDGKTSDFIPFAHAPRAAATMRREQKIDFPDGLQPWAAELMAREHVSRNSEPGYTGTITLKGVDPQVHDTIVGTTGGGELVPVPKQLVRAGMSIRLDGFQGRQEGPVLFITEVSHSVEQNSATLTVDSKYRDYLTVQEVQIRGRDALRPMHLMTVGDYSDTIEDRLLPWSYQRSGYAPFKSRKIWDMWELDHNNTDTLDFPWTEMTTKYPPKNYGKYYMTIPAAGKGSRGRANKLASTEPHWSRYANLTKEDEADPEKRARLNDKSRSNGLVLLSAKGDISAIKVVCVDADGNPLPVAFHVSLWYNPGQRALGATPVLQGDYPASYDKGGANYYPGFVDTKTRYYKLGEPYPFYPYAWSTRLPDGSTYNSDGRVKKTGNMIQAWGTYWDRPGYWPWSLQDAWQQEDEPFEEKRTGMFVDDTGFGYDMISNGSSLKMNESGSPDTISGYTLRDHAAAQMLIFCDDAIYKDKYFIARLYRKNPGSSG